MDVLPLRISTSIDVAACPLTDCLGMLGAFEVDFARRFGDSDPDVVEADIIEDDRSREGTSVVRSCEEESGGVFYVRIDDGFCTCGLEEPGQTG